MDTKSFSINHLLSLSVLLTIGLCFFLNNNYLLGGFVSFHLNSDLEIYYLMDSLYFNYSNHSTNLDSGFGDLLSGGLTSSQLLNSFNTPRFGFWEFTTHSSNTIMDNNNRYVKYFYIFF